MSRGGISRSLARSCLSQLDQPEQFFGPVEREDFPAPGIRVQHVGELGHFPGGFVGERQRQAVAGQASGQAVEILARLRLDPGQRVPDRLGLHDADRFAVGVEQVVCVA